MTELDLKATAAQKFSQKFGDNNFKEIIIEPNGTLHTTYFALGLTIFKSFLETLLEEKKMFLKLITIISLIIFAPMLLIINPIFCFFWEKVYKQEGFTAGYHVLAKKA